MHDDRFDWRDAARAGMGLLGWSPDIFWGATPADMRLAMEGRYPMPTDSGGLTRSELVTLRERFPDKK